MGRAFGWTLLACGAVVACSSSGSSSGPSAEENVTPRLASAVSEHLAPSLTGTTWSLAVDDDQPHPSEGRQRPPRAPLASAKAPVATDPFAPAPAPIPQLTYQNGPMLQNVDIHAVYWGSKVALPTGVDLSPYFSAIAGSGPFFQMLVEYDVTKPAPYTIGAGTFAETVVDPDAPPGAPSPAGRPTVTDEMVQAELSRLIDQGLVKKTDNSLYFFFFPPGTDVDQGDGSLSCKVFCGYHGSFLRNAGSVYYAIIPDFTVDCAKGCGTDGTQGIYLTMSHELVEAVTDSDVGQGNLAWYDNANGEVGDICGGFAGSASGQPVQLMWSNEAFGCRDHKSTELDTVVVTPAEQTAAAGTSTTFSLALSGNAGAASLGVAGLPTQNGVPVVATAPDGGAPGFVPASISPGASATATLALASNARSGDLPFMATATDTVGVVHYAQPTIHVVGPAPTITSFTPATGPTSGGTSVTVTGTNFGINSTATVGGVAAQGTYKRGTNGAEFDLVTPSHAAGNATIIITNVNDAAHPVSSAAPFVYVAGPAPAVTSIAPNAGPTSGGNTVAVIGTGFSPNTVVSFGGVVANPNTTGATFVDPTTFLIYTMPAHAAGAVDVVVKNADGQSATLQGGYTYGADPTPTVTSLSVSQGPTTGGTYVTLYGNGFLAAPTVKFGGTAASVTTVNDSFLGVTTPAHAAGAVSVEVTGPDGQTKAAPTSFTYIEAADGGADAAPDGSAGDSGPPGDSGPAPIEAGTGAAGSGKSGCGCAVLGRTSGSNPLSLLGLGVVAVLVGRRRARRHP